MGDRTGISWTDATWNPIRGCSRVSEGCRNCYAENVAARFSRPGQPYEGLAVNRLVQSMHGLKTEPRWTGEVRFVPEQLDQPLRWKRPRRIFVNSMSDLFHEKLTDEQIDQVFAVMALAPQHTFQVLTKRPDRMGDYITNHVASKRSDVWVWNGPVTEDGKNGANMRFPLPNVWLGVSVENQQTADERIPLLLQTPAAVRFVSAEPLLGPVNFDRIGTWRSEPLSALDEQVGYVERPRLDWVIVGGESGPGARLCDVAWIHSIVEQCRDAGVACFVKQLGAKPLLGATDSLERIVRDGNPHLRSRKGDDPAEWPQDLRVQRSPHTVNA